MNEVTQIIKAVEEGDAQAAEDLLPLAYTELRRLAAFMMSSERDGHTLQPTSLVHEAYGKLLGSNGERVWNGKEHFFAAAADAMRKILIDSARKKRTLKRGGNLNRTTWDDAKFASELTSDEILAVDAALGRLEQQKPDLAKLVKLRYFAGLSIAETAAALGLSKSGVDRSWRGARAWLYREISTENAPDDS
jgi:RNA polymerase sigma factor (TIGR02999 family)